MCCHVKMCEQLNMKGQAKHKLSLLHWLTLALVLMNVSPHGPHYGPALSCQQPRSCILNSTTWLNKTSQKLLVTKARGWQGWKQLHFSLPPLSNQSTPALFQANFLKQSACLNKKKKRKHYLQEEWLPCGVMTPLSRWKGRFHHDLRLRESCVT